MVSHCKKKHVDYEAILEADQNGYLWPTGQCLTTGCSAEIPFTNRRGTAKSRISTFASEFW